MLKCSPPKTVIHQINHLFFLTFKFFIKKYSDSLSAHEHCDSIFFDFEQKNFLNEQVNGDTMIIKFESLKVIDFFVRQSDDVPRHISGKLTTIFGTQPYLFRLMNSIICTS